MHENRIGKAVLTLLLGGILTLPKAFADVLPHLFPNNLQIHSERVLSGVDLFKGTITGVIARLGQPSHVTNVPRKQLSLATQIYEWQTRSGSLRVIVSDESSFAPMITRIDVWGSNPDAEIGTSGRGLKLGDTINDVRRIYRLNSYFGATLPENIGLLGTATLDYESPVLAIDFDKAGKINHMKLTNPCVPFCW